MEYVLLFGTAENDGTASWTAELFVEGKDS
jgi:hypothetical protein